MKPRFANHPVRVRPVGNKPDALIRWPPLRNESFERKLDALTLAVLNLLGNEICGEDDVLPVFFQTTVQDLVTFGVESGRCGKHQIDHHGLRSRIHQPFDHVGIDLARPWKQFVHQLERTRPFDILGEGGRILQGEAGLIDPQHDHVRVRRGFCAEGMDEIIDLPFKKLERL